MNGNKLKTILLVAACGWGLWKLGREWFGPAVTPGEVTMLTDSNFGEVQQSAATLVAIFTRPG